MAIDNPANPAFLIGTAPAPSNEGAPGGAAASARPPGIPPRGQVVLAITLVIPASGLINAPEYRLADDETVELRPFSSNTGTINVFIGQNSAQAAASPLYSLAKTDVPQLVTMQGRGLWELWLQGTANDKLTVTVRKGA